MNYISSQVARKILSEYRTRQNREWFTELETVQTTLRACEEGCKKQYPGFNLDRIFILFY